MCKSAISITNKCPSFDLLRFIVGYFGEYSCNSFIKSSANLFFASVLKFGFLKNRLLLSVLNHPCFTSSGLMPAAILSSFIRLYFWIRSNSSFLSRNLRAFLFSIVANIVKTKLHNFSSKQQRTKQQLRL